MFQYLWMQKIFEVLITFIIKLPINKQYKTISFKVVYSRCFVCTWKKKCAYALFGIYYLIIYSYRIYFMLVKWNVKSIIKICVVCNIFCTFKKLFQNFILFFILIFTVSLSKHCRENVFNHVVILVFNILFMDIICIPKNTS